MSAHGLEHRYCVDIGGDVAYDVEEHKEFGVLQAIALHSKMWPQFEQINISFMGGTRRQQQIVRDVVNREFVPLVNLRLNFVHSRGDIRISFDQLGAWSFLGTDARLSNRSQPTMNLGFLDEPGSRGDAYMNYGVIKHEFGHAIGAFLHEHSHPDSGFTWDEEAVVADLSGRPNFWNRRQIQTNMFDRYARSEIRSTEYDRLSIMHYFFPAYWTLEKVEMQANQDLSEQDIYFLRMEYPPRVNLPIELRDTTTPPHLLYSQNDATVRIEPEECNSDKTLLIMMFVALFLAAMGFMLGRANIPKSKHF
jgi:hypothetical protein